MPIDVYSLWILIKNSLDPRPEGAKEGSHVEQPESKLPPAPPLLLAPPEIPKPESLEKNDSPLDPGGVDEFEKETARYHKDDFTKVVGATQKLRLSQKESHKPVGQELVVEEVQRLQGTVTSLAVQVQQIQTKQATQQLPKHSNQ